MGLGVLCLETYWSDDPLDRRHSRGLLEVLELNMDGVLAVHRHVATRADLEHYLNDEWRRNDVYDVLYIASHGKAGAVAGERGGFITLKWLARELENSCTGRVVLFGGCETMAVRPTILKDFVARTDAAAVVGYTTQIEWMEAAQMELSLLGALATEGPGETGIWKRPPGETLLDLRSEHERFADRIGWTVVAGDQQPTGVERRQPADGFRWALSDLERVALDGAVAGGVRVRALEALGALGDRGSLTIFTGLAREPRTDVEVREAAVRALGRLRDRAPALSSLAKLRAWLSKDPPGPAEATARLLAAVDEAVAGLASG